MLVLSRKSQESVAVGEAGWAKCLVKVTVLDVIGGKVRLGFEAGPDLPIHRWEVWERIHAEAGADASPAVAPEAT